MRYKTRNSWLAAAVSLFRPAFRRILWTLPRRLIVKSERCFRNDSWAECWYPEPLIKISPECSDGYGALTLLAHELSHAAVNHHLKRQSGHGAEFIAVAQAIGLGPEGKFPVCSWLELDCLLFVKKLGRYPTK